MRPVKVKIVFEDGTEREFEAFAGWFGNPGEEMKMFYRLPTLAGWEGFDFLLRVAKNLSALAFEIRAKAEELIPKYAG